MTGYPRYNFDKFYECEAWLKERGIKTHNPARVDQEVYGFNPDWSVEQQGFNVEAALSRDVEFIVSGACTGVVVLPEWELSTGAKWEVGVAQTIGLPVHEWDGEQLVEVPTVVKCVVTKR